MFTPSSLIRLTKIVPALTLSLILPLVSTHAKLSSAIAQTDGTLIENSDFEPPRDDRADGVFISTGTYFTPPRESRPRSGSRTTTGTRTGGCLGDTETAFTLFGPDATLGRTAESHPSFVWHLPETATPVPVIFRLLAPNDRGIPETIYSAELAYNAGVVKYQLPLETPALQVGPEYRWQVILECDAYYPSRAMVQELSFEVVPSPSGLVPQLASVSNASERATVYGQEGLWYDAIAQVYDADTGAAKDVRNGLLQDLATLAISSDRIRQNILTIVGSTAEITPSEM